MKELRFKNALFGNSLEAFMKITVVTNLLVYKLGITYSQICIIF